MTTKDSDMCYSVTGLKVFIAKHHPQYTLIADSVDESSLLELYKPKDGLIRLDTYWLGEFHRHVGYYGQGRIILDGEFTKDELLLFLKLMSR